jgi:colicin import membrane protein
LKSAYVNNIRARVITYWRYQGAEDDWVCNVYVQQDTGGNVEAVNVQNCNLDDSDMARAFKNSIERAVYKASPLPSAPDDAVFDREILFEFGVN